MVLAVGPRDRNLRETLLLGKSTLNLSFITMYLFTNATVDLFRSLLT